MLALFINHGRLMNIRKRYSFNLFMQGCIVLLSQLVALPGVFADTEFPRQLSVSISQRNDNLNWNISGSTVNVLSELKWDDLSITQVQAAVDLQLEKDRRLSVRAGYGLVNSGTNQDSDYNGNNRTQEFSRSYSNAGGDVFDASLGFGKRLRMHDSNQERSIYLTPFIGISLNRQNLTMTDGVQAISLPPSTTPLGPFPGMASSYDAEWLGPWLGMEMLIETERGWSVKADMEYHLVNYSASANWNLRTDLAHPVSFRHNATGEGIVLSLGTSYRIKKSWKASLQLELNEWNTRAGTDQVFLANGTVGYTRLNEVNWNSTALSLGVVHDF